MTRGFGLAIFLVPVVVLALMAAAGLPLLIVRSSDPPQPVVGLTAEATLETHGGVFVGTVAFLQAASGVLIKAEAKGLPYGGHAFIIHETGACNPDFGAAGDHFNPGEVEHGFIHGGWKRGGGEAHGGDLPNIYVASDGTARADFFTEGISLDVDQPHSIFDSDGSAIVVHEFPDTYGEGESDTGSRLACGVIRQN